VIYRLPIKATIIHGEQSSENIIFEYKSCNEFSIQNLMKTLNVVLVFINQIFNRLSKNPAIFCSFVIHMALYSTCNKLTCENFVIILTENYGC
jgi:hypothetical protein